MRRTDDEFLALLRPEQGKLMRIARALTGQEADAWDLVQEATLTAYDRFTELRGGPEERLDQALLWDEVMRLEEHHRQVLVLRFLVDMQVDEVSDLLGVPAGTVKSRIHRALGALRKRLESMVREVAKPV